jgi:hypothetical protein
MQNSFYHDFPPDVYQWRVCPKCGSQMLEIDWDNPKVAEDDLKHPKSPISGNRMCSDKCTAWLMSYVGKNPVGKVGSIYQYDLQRAC